MANEYAASIDLKLTLELIGENFADDDVALALTAASRGIDKATRRRFYLDSDALQVRYFTPRRGDWLAIDDLVTLTSLRTDPGGDGTFEDVWTVNTDFTLEPLNAAADGEPWRAIRRHPQGRFQLPGNQSWSDAGDMPRSVQVTGRFGWLAVPAEVKEATMILAARLMRRAREAPFGVVALGMDGAAAHIARTDPDVRFLLSGLTRNSFGIR